MDYWLIGELAFTGALVGLMYALVAVGIVLVYKTSGVANFAQGAIAMTGGYATWAISAGLGLPMWAAIPLALSVIHAQAQTPQEQYEKARKDYEKALKDYESVLKDQKARAERARQERCDRNPPMNDM